MAVSPFGGRGASSFAAAVMLLSITIPVMPAMARHPHDGPPGWSHGEKRGWRGHDEPPGWRKHHGDGDDYREQEDEGDYNRGYRASSYYGSRGSSYGRGSSYARRYRRAPQQPTTRIRSYRGSYRRTPQKPTISIHSGRASSRAASGLPSIGTLGGLSGLPGTSGLLNTVLQQLNH